MIDTPIGSASSGPETIRPTARLCSKAVWGPDGAVCVRRKRISEVLSTNDLAERYPQLADRIGSGCTEARRRSDMEQILTASRPLSATSEPPARSHPESARRGTPPRVPNLRGKIQVFCGGDGTGKGWQQQMHEYLSPRCQRRHRGPSYGNVAERV
jgi:hypothetical protein